MREPIDTYVFRDTFGGGKTMRFVLYTSWDQLDQTSNIITISGYVGNVDESPLEAPWAVGNIINISTPNVVGSLRVTDLIHGNRLACVRDSGVVEIHAKPLEKPPPEEWNVWRASEASAKGEAIYSGESGFYCRLKCDGHSVELGAPTLDGLLALMRAKGIELPGDYSVKESHETNSDNRS